MGYKSKVETCRIEECISPLKSRGMCEKHYKRWQTHGNPNVLLQIDCKNKICENDQCHKSARKQGLCNSHYTKKWRLNNPALAHKNMQQSWRNRSVRKKLIKVHHTRSEWEDLLLKYGGICAYCRKLEATTRDHVVAIINGGSDLIENILPACRSCNCSKHTKVLEIWLLEKGYNNPLGIKSQ